jgi:Signal peptide peptidase
VVTTVFLILMRTGQPALLYIVPILLSTVFFIAWRRREFSQLWDGNLVSQYWTIDLSMTASLFSFIPWQHKIDSFFSLTDGFIPILLRNIVGFKQLSKVNE